MSTWQRLAERLRRATGRRDARSRKVVFVPHCALNQNARVAGAAESPAAMGALIAGLIEREIGIVQMPCPELCAYGLERVEVDVERDLRSPAGRELCRRLAREQLHQIKAYHEGGIRVLGVLGKNGSPSCGVEDTWNAGPCPGRGAFIEELAAEMQAAGLAIEITGVRDREPDRALAVVDRWLAATAGRTGSPAGSLLLLVALLLLSGIQPPAEAESSRVTATIVELGTLCGDCHDGQCSES